MVLIEGTEQPCVYLARGARRTVPWTAAVARLVAGGYVRVLARQDVTLGRQHG